MEKPIVHADGSVRLRLPTPRGIVSVLALFASGLVFAVSGLTWLMGMTAPGGDVPGALTVTASLSLVALVAIAVDRAWARARGVEVRFQPAHDDAPARYSILCDRKTLEDGPLARTRLCVAPLPYPRDDAQPLFTPATALYLRADHVDARYRADVAGRGAYVLSSASVVERTLDETLALCKTLRVDMADTVDILMPPLRPRGSESESDTSRHP